MSDTTSTLLEAAKPDQGASEMGTSIPMPQELTVNSNTDPYNEDEAELRFLHSKPTCFILLGKPGAGKTTLATKLAMEWKCELVNATQVISQAIELQTEMGLKCQELLLRGEAIPEDVAAKMVEDKINSSEVAHHGYILDDFPSLSEDYMTIKDQLDLVNNWKLKPDFIVNLKIPDRDLEARRIGQRVDSQTGDVITKEVYNPDKPQKGGQDQGEGEEEEEEEEEEEMEEEGEEAELPSDVLERLVRRPEDIPDHVTSHIQRFKSSMLSILEDYMADHDQQYLIELDANKSGNDLFKELMTRLSCFVLRPAAVPIRLQTPDDDELPEEIETDELMRSLAARQMVAPRFRWRRSRWLRNCPVALSEGNIVPGKPEFAVSFLDKMYVLSSAEAMEKFLKNPRPYLLPPQPRPPCKLCITGPPLSGKTTLSHQLAQKYGAKVLDMEKLIQPKLEEEKEKIIEQARQEATENAITTVRTKIKEAQEAEKLREEQLTTETLEETQTADEALDEDIKEGARLDESQSDSDQKEPEKEEETKEEATNDTTLDTTVDEQESVKQTDESVVDSEKPDPGAESIATTDTTMIEVTSDHPEVIAMVEAAVQAVEAQPVVLPPEVYVDVMQEAIQEVEKEMRKDNPNGPLNGGWIMDHFPATREQWNVLVEKSLMPDEVICLRDDSENGSFLLQRWYTLNKAEIDAQIQKRKEQEEIERIRAKELERQKAEEERKAAEEEARRLKEEERQRRLEAGEIVSDDEGEGQEKEGEETAPAETEEAPEAPETLAPPESGGEGSSTPEVSTTIDTTATTEKKTDDDAGEEVAPGEPEPEQLPPEGPELEAQREKRKKFDTEWPNILAVITGNTSVEPLTPDIQDKDEENLAADVAKLLERNFTYQGWENTGMDIDEEEEDMEADQNEEEEEEAEEEEDPNRSQKKALGDTNYFCPVALKETFMLWPGNPEIAARYRERLYYFSSEEARVKFLATPSEYLPVEKPLKTPPVRLLILGPKGAGKSLHGRALANKLGVFHIQFRERLQELIIAKTKKKIGPEYEEEQEEEEPEEEEEEETPAIVGPEGSISEPSASPEKETSKVSTSSEEGKQESGAAADGEEEGEEEPELTEDEQAIKDYLETDEALPPEFLDKLVGSWWNQEPFKSSGFVLEGFPRSVDEATYMAEAGLFPDAAIILNVEDTDVIARLLPPKLDRWKQRRDRRLAKKQKAKEKAKKKREAEIAKRREELVKEIEEKKAERRAERAAERDSDDAESDVEEEEEEEEEEDDVELILAEEFPEEEEEEEDEEETEEDATDRMRNDLEEVFDNDMNRLASVQERLEESLIPRLELEAGRKPHIVWYIMAKKLRPIIQFRHSLFERVYTISENLAIRMLKTGYKQPSRFGRWCPIRLSEGDCIQPMQGPGYPTYPAIYRQFIYFLSSPQAREQFVQDPMTYLTQISPKPVVPMKIAIIGPPKSGKTTLARRFENHFGMMRLSIGEAMRQVMEMQPKSQLVKDIKQHLQAGVTVPDELAVQALEVMLMDMRAQTRGYILDGFPTNKHQVELMTQRSIIPFRVFELVVDSREAMTRATKDRYSQDRIFALHDSAQIFAIKLAGHQREVQGVRAWYQQEHQNWVPINGEHSKWWVWNKALEISKSSVTQIQTYLQRTADGKAASIADMCITHREFEERLGDYGQYCPVRLARNGELVDNSTNPTLDYAAEFRGYYYKMAGQAEVDQFLAEPEKFVPPLAPNKLPPKELLPKRRTAQDVKALFPKPIELQGYCSVTFLDGKCRYEAIVPGNPDLVVEYREKLFCFATEENLHKFMHLPEKYWNLKLPHKLPPKKEPLAVTGLPMLGFMEQTVSQAVIKAMTAVGTFKPKFPFLTPSRSALLYVAYHLKAYNPKSSEYVRKKYRKKLAQFEETCELINYLGNTMTKRYREPRDRPIDFDFKLKKFMQLKAREAEATSVV